MMTFTVIDDSWSELFDISIKNDIACLLIRQNKILTMPVLDGEGKLKREKFVIKHGDVIAMIAEMVAF